MLALRILLNAYADIVADFGALADNRLFNHAVFADFSARHNHRIGNFRTLAHVYRAENNGVVYFAVNEAALRNGRIGNFRIIADIVRRERMVSRINYP